MFQQVLRDLYPTAIQKEIMCNSDRDLYGITNDMVNTNSYIKTYEEAVALGGASFHPCLENTSTTRDSMNNRQYTNFLTNHNPISSTENDTIIKTESLLNNVDSYGIPMCQMSHVKQLTFKKASKDLKFPCEYCNKTFAKKQQLQNHTKTHTKEKNFICATCQKGFIHKQQLTNHEKTHSGNKDFKCSFCDKCFMLKQQLQIHSKIHTGEKNFACNMCEKAFITKQQLQNHVNSHLGIKPFGCNECQKKFAHKQQLERHVKNHSIKQNYTCSECNGKFLTKTAFNEHFKDIHVEQGQNEILGIPSCTAAFNRL